MTQRVHTRRGIFLAELLGMLVIGGVLLVILGHLILDAIYLQRIVAQHANRIAVMDALVDRLARDSLAAVAYEFDETTLRFDVVTGDGAATVTYTLEPDVVRRTASNGDEADWRSVRLEFAWQKETGRRADVLRLDFVEAPPPRWAQLPLRTFSMPFVLPPGRVAAVRPAEGAP